MKKPAFSRYIYKIAILVVISFLFNLVAAGCHKADQETIDKKAQYETIPTPTETKNPPATISLSMEKTSIILNETISVSVIIRDAVGKPVAKRTKVFCSVEPYDPNNPFGRFLPDPNTETLDDTGNISISFEPLRVGTCFLKARTSNGVVAKRLLTIEKISGSWEAAGIPSETNAAYINLIADSSSLYANGFTTTTITAHVMDSNNTAVTDKTPVSFIVLNGSSKSGLIQDSAMTSGGIAKVTYTSGTIPGIITIQASCDKVKETIELTLKPLVPYSISVKTPGTIRVGESATITATVKDELDIAISGAEVTFTTSAGDFDPNISGIQKEITIISSDGDAAALLRGPTTFGKVTVTAKSDKVISSPTYILFIPGLPESIDVEAEPADLLADGASSSSITVTVLDAYGNPVEDGTSIILDPDNKIDGTISPRSITTTNGIAKATYISPSFSSTSSDIVSVRTTNGKTGEQLIHLSGAQISSVNLEVEPDSLPADGKSQAAVRAFVNLAGGGMAPDGTEVVFTITEGNGTFVGSDSSETSAYTAGGVAYATLRSASVEGTAAIQAFSGGITAEIRIQYTPGRVELSIIPNSLLGTGYEKAMVIASLLTTDGALAEDDPNQTVTFTLSNGSLGKLYNPSTQNTSDKIVITPSGGQAQAIFLAGSKEGEVTVTATWSPSGIDINGSGPITIQPPPADIQIVDKHPDPDAINVKGTGGISTSTIVFRVIDGHGNDVPDGYRIDFSIDSGPNGAETINPLSARTKDGKVNTKLRSGYKSGPVSIRATYYHDTTITTTISSITINAGPPVGEEFGIAAQFRNISGLSYSFLEDIIKIGTGDIYGNSIPDDTAISFKTYNTGGSFMENSGLTLNGICSDILVSKEPFPSQGFLSVTAETNNGGRTTHITGIAVTPYPDSHIIYAGTNGGGVYKSTDKGSSWKNISRSSKAGEHGQNWIDPYINDIDVDPDNHNTVYAATGYLGKGNLYRSLDGGLNWNSNDPEEWNGTIAMTEAVLTVLCDGDDDPGTDFPYVWIGTEGQGALYSTDGKHFIWGGIAEPFHTTEERQIYPGVSVYINPDNEGNGTMTIPTLSYTSKTETWKVTYLKKGIDVSFARLNTNASGSNADGAIDPNPPTASYNADNQEWTFTYIGGIDPVYPHTLSVPGKGELILISTSQNTQTEIWTVTYKDPTYNPSVINDANNIVGDEYFEVRGSLSGLQKEYEDITKEYASNKNEVIFSINSFKDLGKIDPEGFSFTFKTLMDAWRVESQKLGYPVERHSSANTGRRYTSDNFEVELTIKPGTIFYKYGDFWRFSTTVLGKWLVTGNVSGTQYRLGETGLPYESDNEETRFTIQEGNIRFSVGDSFSFRITSSGLGAKNYVRDIAKVPGTHGNTAILYAATKTGVYKTINGGILWDELTSFTGDSINTIKLHPCSNGINDIIYVGTDDAGIWSSMDSGRTWKRHSEGLGKGLSASIPIAEQGNKGNGVIREVTIDQNVKTEDWTVTCTEAVRDGGEFTVSGTISGVQTNPAIVGSHYTSDDGSISFTIFDGTFDFEAGDNFSFSTTRDPGSYIEDILIDHINNKIYAITYFWGSFEPHAIGNIHVHDLAPGDASITPDRWKEANLGLPQYDPPDDKTLFAQHALGKASDTNDPDKIEYLYIGGEGINLFRADTGIEQGVPVWYESKNGLTNLIMARMPVLFSGECSMKITENLIWEDNYVKNIIFTVYIEDIYGNPPILGSIFKVEHVTPDRTFLLADITYPDCYTYRGTFRDPSDASTDNPYVFSVNVRAENEVIFTYIPTNKYPDPPGSSGSSLIKSFSY